MNTVVTRKQTSFRLNKTLLDNLRIEAKKHNRSLNNFVESILMAFLAEHPNRTTLAAMSDAKTGHALEELDLADFQNFISSL